MNAERLFAQTEKLCCVPSVQSGHMLHASDLKQDVNITWTT